MKRCFPWLVLALALFGCGKKPEDQAPVRVATPYGSPQEVAAYVQAVDPLVMQLNTLHQDLYQQVGTSGKATGANLAAAMELGRPKLAQVLADLDRLTPPPLLVPFHQQVKKVVQLRLDAYTQTLEGWKIEKDKGTDFESRYNRGEALLAEAQQLGGQLGAERGRIQEALAATQAPAPPSR
ncbi:MAG: hypothetical protein IT369_22375 [Candidatus Latescibacteria bacterium]|nr:hypothetical protein [Candidatus Latescibacterota bacterium]